MQLRDVLRCWTPRPKTRRSRRPLLIAGRPGRRGPAHAARAGPRGGAFKAGGKPWSPGAPPSTSAGTPSPRRPTKSGCTRWAGCKSEGYGRLRNYYKTRSTRLASRSTSSASTSEELRRTVTSTTAPRRDVGKPTPLSQPRCGAPTPASVESARPPARGRRDARHRRFAAARGAAAGDRAKLALDANSSPR